MVDGRTDLANTNESSNNVPLLIGKGEMTAPLA
ncbi:MAG: hypothetical protein IRD9MM_01735 [Candidatus Midichloria mitochondrii]